MKRKDSKETVRAFLIMIKKRIDPAEIWIDKGTKFAGDCRKISKTKRIQIYYTMSETEAAFAGRTIRSLKEELYRYMEG